MANALAPATCAVAPTLFTTTCLNDLVVQLEPVIAQDNKNCFEEAYKGTTLSNLIISPKGATPGEVVCTAAPEDKAWYGQQNPVQTVPTTLFWGAKTLDKKVTTNGIWFSASSCGITPGPQTVKVPDPNADPTTGATVDKTYMQFATTIMSQFDNTPNSVLTKQEMLETNVICNYEMTVDGIAVPIATKLDAVEDVNKIKQDDDTNDIAAAQVGKTIKVDTAPYVSGSAVTLGSAIDINFDSIGELTNGFYIDSCIADNQLEEMVVTSPTDSTLIKNVNYKKLDLITNSCAASTAGDATMTSINPATTGTKFTFNQFAFVDQQSSFAAPKLAFELNCVLKFGNKPSCTGSGSGGSGSGSGRRRRDVGQDDASVSVSFTVTPGDGDYSISDGVVTGTAKAADSGANEMMVSALAASAFLLL